MTRDLLAASGVRLGHKTALRLTCSVCDDALRARKQAMRAQQGPDDDGGFADRRAVVTVDGGRTNIRRRVAGPPQRRPEALRDGVARAEGADAVRPG